MAEPVTHEPTSGPTIEDAFIADRQVFWGRFTSFTTGGVAVVIGLLLVLLIFVY